MAGQLAVGRPMIGLTVSVTGPGKGKKSTLRSKVWACGARAVFCSQELRPRPTMS